MTGFGDTPAGLAAGPAGARGMALTIDAATYHQDNFGTDQPCLSASLIHVLCTASPKHAWANHPKLNPRYARDDDPKFDRGSAAHALLLQGIDIVSVIGANDWRTNAAKEEREEARTAGRIPLLAKDWDAVKTMVDAVQQQLADLEPRPFVDGKPEQTLVWEERGVMCKARLDWLTDRHDHIFDLKTTSRTANPETWSRMLFGIGADLQHEWYRRGVRAIYGAMPVFTFVVCETEAPYAVSRVTLAPDAETFANAKIDAALGEWADCLESGNWPAYRPDIAYANAPSWEMSRWLEREEAA